MSIFTLNGRALGPDTPFEHNGVQYDSVESLNQELKDEIGIVEIDSYPNYDQRFWWGVTPEGDYIPKRLDKLVDLWIETTNQEANRRLSVTDWLVIREMDNGEPVPQEIKTLRQQIRDSSNTKINKIQTSLNVGTLAKYLTSAEYNSWPPYPEENVGIAST